MIEDFLKDSDCVLDPENDVADSATLVYLSSLTPENLAALTKAAVIMSAMHLVGDPVQVSDELKYESVFRVLKFLKEGFEIRKEEKKNQ